MQGMSLASLKKHRALIPLYGCVILGCGGAAYYLLRLATRNPDVAWVNRPDGISNEAYRDKQYKFYSPSMDYKDIKCEAPKY